MTTLAVERDRLLRNGTPHLIISGAVHYFRVHPDLWDDRLRRLVALGCNTVETYVAWNWHAPSADEVTFEGPADLGRFLDLAAGLGLDVIVRPGPYICAEWEGGGFPGWLTADPTLPLRCSDPRYLAAVDAWFDRLIPVIAPRQATRGGRVVAVQVENEYGSYGDDTAYLEHLRDGLRRRGIEELLVTSDGPGRGWLSGGTVDGAWATVNFGSRALEVLEMAAEELPDQPQMCMEFWNGWFDHWGEEHHVRSAESAAQELDDMLSHQMSVNLYMAHGGTNTGLWAGANHDERHAPTVTSYDYDAPIAENGALTEKFRAFREVIARHRELPLLDEHLAALGLVAEPPALGSQPLPWTGLGSLRGTALWDAPGRRFPCTPSFEEQGLERGMQLLSRRIEIDASGEHDVAPIRFHGLADRAYVWLDGRFAGIADRNADEVSVPVQPLVADLLGGDRRRDVLLEILVENQGRANFGPHLGERKGILGGVWFGMRFLNGWDVQAWPLETMADRVAEAASTAATASAPQLPVVGTADLTVATGGSDAFLDTSACGRGVAWIDDVCLGRYWTLGPQQTLYIPAPLLTRGTHRLTILELERLDPTISLAAGPILGPTA